MKTIVSIFIVCFIFQSKGTAQPKASYDSVLAKKLGGDNYGMKK